MPGLTGLQVAAVLRADALTPHLLILMITGGEVSDEDAARVDRLASKPLRPRQLAGFMADMLTAGTRVRR